MARSFVKAVKKIIYSIDELQHKRLVIPVTNETAKIPTVYFLTPDHDIPSGGIRVIYRHVDLLNSAGIRAFVLHQRRGFRCSWFTHDTCVTDVKSCTVGLGDLLVVSEPDVCLISKKLLSIRHVIFNQNSHLTWKRASESVTSHYKSSSYLAGAIVVSDHNKDMLRYAFKGLSVRRIHLGIDPSLLHPGDGLYRSRRIAYMPRKGGTDAEMVLNLLRGRGILDGWEVVPINGLTHAEVADQLRTTRIFLAFTYQEGFGLPAAEAMACGNYVIGCHGFGGREFFRPEFSAIIEAGDVLSFARAVEDAIIHDRANSSWCLDRGREASAFILDKYTPEQERDEVVSAYGELLDLSTTMVES